MYDHFPMSEYRFYVTFSAILRLSSEKPVVTAGGNRCTRRKKNAQPQVTGNFLTYPVLYLIVFNSWYCFVIKDMVPIVLTLLDQEVTDN